MIAIIDYDAGNIRSVEKAVKFLGRDCKVTSDGSEILSADHVILPGVGNFGDCMAHLRDRGLVDVIRKVQENDTPFLGICVGLQLIFNDSEESEGVEGLGLLPGHIIKFPERKDLKVPHMGWNSIRFPKAGRLFKGIEEGSFVYFVHSYYLKADDPSIVTATCEYGLNFDASVEKGNVFATQFHPEKSGETGLQILNNFLEI
ncbi:MAG: imidazole glycerol phosphate synthase subunit HisH [Lachnospiraceae bacterium]|uniref:Imidazole glycerol phosphate synthase subunit HisH n=1 Tax=Candidatus Weimeria bifida TaxID=2599074 RepID=A0A6N7IW87_9FIRM|nr:imidazole glycerol phosphate synthase subunit HisH [Candidatus Weimeria bifida]RRF96084.1 MAG: imidazole glycerol phosphate synthase subunit HisH [Lachnospiraceae bacterium]